MIMIKKPLMVWFLLYTIFSYSQATITGELQKWHTVSITFNGPNTSETSNTNPFLNYRLNVTFTSPSGKSFIVPGFYAADGNAAQTSANSGDKWRVRFTPNETGNWTYNTSFRTGTNVALSENSNAGNATSFNGASGNFNISASTKNVPDNRARGRLNYVGERYLKFEETGEYFLKAGSDSPENLLAYNDFDNTVAKKTWGPHAQDWQNGDPVWKGNDGKELIGAINYLASKGMNAFSFLTMSVKGDGKDVWPWVATTNNSLDGDSGAEASNRLRYDVSKLAQWEILFSHADKKGMYLHFKTQETENDRLLDRGELGTQRKLYYRELIARFGHHLALNWNLGEEHNLYRELNDTENTRVKDYATYIKNTDPYAHNIVIHSYPGSNDQESLYRPLLGNRSNLTGASAQLQINSIHADIKKWVLASKNSGKPWVVANDEQGDAQSGVTADANFNGAKGSKGDNRKDTRHKVLWGTLMAGGAGVEYYFGYQTGETDLTAQNFRSRNTKWNDAKIALDFFNTHLRFWEMETNDGLTSSTTDYCLAKVNEAYAIYLPNGGSTNLNLSNTNGSFTVKWFNPANGGRLVNGSVTQISGGGNRSIGNPPNNTSADWVALIKKGDSDGKTDDCSLNMSAIANFSNTNISGFSPAYADNTRNALAIDASRYKNTFAAAESIFNGKTATYDIQLNTLTELDGESTYRLKVNGTLVGTYKNPTTTVDYAPSNKTFKNVYVNKGDVIRVEFNSNTNGKIPEGNSTAYSRGRWTSLNFLCQLETAEFQVVNCDADAEEKNGLVVIEAERLENGSGWVNSTSTNGFTGNGYIDWQGADSFNTPGNGTITAKIKINTPGVYLFQWRSKVGEGTNSTESNDSWLRFPDADDFYGEKGNSKIYPTGSGKTPNPKGSSSNGWFKVFLSGTTNWTWTSFTSDNDAHKIYVKFDTAATYTMEISGRSKHHLLDRIVLSKNVSNATNLSLEETLCAAGETAPVSVTGVTVSPQNSTVFEGNSVNLSAQVLPQDASNKNVVWSSSDTSIATVNQNGTVSALEKGTAVITAITEDGNFSSQANITVQKRDGVSVPVTGVLVTPQQLTLEAGRTVVLSYEMRPSNASNKNVTWSSTDNSIATVDQNGKVTLLRQGDVEIEALSEDGNYRSDATIKVLKGAIGTNPVVGILVTPQRITIETGQTTKLAFSIRPSNASNKNATWRSSDTSIATVDQNGVVTALKQGSVEIEAISAEGGYVSDSSINVIPATGGGVAVTGISISRSSATVVEGNSIILTHQISPNNASNKQVFWASSNTSIATVNQNGVVSASRVGEVAITVKSKDGDYVAISNIKVIKKPTIGRLVTRIYVTPQFLNLTAGETVNLTYTISPFNASNKDVIWRSMDKTVATVDQNGKVTALSTGKVEIEVRTIDGDFRSDSSVTVVGSTGTAKQAIIAYPNPTRDEVRIGGIQGNKAWVGVYSMNGVLLEQTNISDGKDVVISLANHPAGTYVVKVLDTSKSAIKTIIKM